jgi:hypothetical protein
MELHGNMDALRKTIATNRQLREELRLLAVNAARDVSERKSLTVNHVEPFAWAHPVEHNHAEKLAR